MSMYMLDVELNGCRAVISYHPYNDSYVASLYHLGLDKFLGSKSFGNGVLAENWILKELSFPESILTLKWS